MPSCEMCGREIYSKPIIIQIEGAELAVCPSCSKHGKQVVKGKTQKSNTNFKVSAQKTISTPKTTSKLLKSDRGYETGKELAPDYSERLRLARQKMNLSQKELSIQTKISISELQSIETGKMRPSDAIVEKLEKFFKIKLTEDVQSYSGKDQQKAPSFQTLGDVVVIKKKKEEDYQ